MSIVKNRRQGQWQVLSGAPPSVIPPDAPTNVYGDSPAAGEIHAFWTAPIKTGHGTLTAYVVTVKKVSDNTTTEVTINISGPPDNYLATKVTVTGLTVGSNYTVTVIARNAAGDSSASAASSPITVSNLTQPLPLHVDTVNKRYLADSNGNIVYLGGSHTWSNLVDNGVGFPPDTPANIFDYTAWLTFIKDRGHNFFRLWRWEHTRWSNQLADPDYWHDPPVYERTGPGLALDGKPKFDLTKFNQAYFDRMRARVIEAGAQGMYPAVMLFEGWSVGYKGAYNFGQPWDGHPMHTSNNINGIVVPVDAEGNGYASQRLDVPEVTALQKLYIEKVVDTIGDLPNVTYEIANEARPDSIPWQYEMVDKVRAYEQKVLGGYNHPVGITITNGAGSSISSLVADASHAEWISFGGDMEDPSSTLGLDFPNDDIRPRVADTDHSCGSCNGSIAWAWTSFTRGFYLLIMDVYDAKGTGVGARDVHNTLDFNEPYTATNLAKDNVRYNVGKVRAYAARMDLKHAIPQDGKASTGYAMVKSGTISDEYLVFSKTGDPFTVDLSASTGTMNVEWYNPTTLLSSTAGTIAAGGVATNFTPPFAGPAVLFLTQ